MKKRSRLISGILATCVVCSAFAGCSSSTNSGTQTSSKASDEKVTIDYSYWVADSDKDQIDLFNKAVADFNKKYPNITVKLDSQPTNKSDDYIKKYDMLLLTGDKTTIIVNTSYIQYAARAKKGLFAAMDDYMKADNASMDEYRMPTTYEGKIYGLPSRSSANIVVMNKDALDEAGLKVPDLEWTWDDYADYAKKLTKTENGKTRYGSVAPFWGDPVMYYLGTAITKEGNPLFKDEKTHNLDDPSLKSWLEFKNKLENVDKSEISYKDYTTGSLNYQSEFFNGDAAMLVTGVWTLQSAGATNTFPHKFKTSVAMLPRFNGSPVGAERDGPEICSINAKASDAEKEAAYKFIRFLTTEGLVTMQGIPAYKNTDYSKIIENIVGDKKDLYDIDSMKKYFEWDKRTSHFVDIAPSQNNEILGIVKEEGDKYLSGGQTIDQAVQNMKKRGDTTMAQ